MAYYSFPTNLKGSSDFTADELTVHADQVVAEMQEQNTNMKVSITCLQVSKTLRKGKALVTLSSYHEQT